MKDAFISTMAMSILIESCIGYLLNFQNIFQYWPENSYVVTSEWFLSFIGIFFPPIGVITGYIW